MSATPQAPSNVVALRRDPVRQAKAESADARRRIREWRLQRGWTTQDLGDQIGLPAAYVEAFEAGQTNPTLEIVCHFAALLGKSLHELTAP
ncbi:helix-turn-helix transcriptional regulator [Brevundimonas vesicularis]|uniref:helix-turn-helix transcriptional regulator n=1 Tax=Brevundimonas vesicularis TaxID=41276 RepID=UPI001574B5F0|nr:helix-turn-helix transcriptional regulator [Brevundimonas vesicularis]NSX34451.1 helix-turn-helix transcriptional regulator [Brevundimonas vesicularis]